MAKKMKVVVVCEREGKLRSRLRELGHDAWSCDLEPAADGSPFHFQDDALKVIGKQQWDLMVAHPPCTHLSLSGARWCADHWVKNKNKGDWWWDGTEKRRLRKLALIFFRKLLEFKKIPRRVLENPMSIASTHIAPKDQVIHPWQFGHGETKETWLWLRGVQPLAPTGIVEGRENIVFNMTPSPERSRLRSVTYDGIADAMALQWAGDARV